LTKTIPSQGFRDSLPDLLQEIYVYIENTYGAHYATDGTNVQVMDLWDNIGIAQAMFQGDLIKYSSRYGKKDGKNPKDLKKILHYAFLLYYFDHVRNKSDDSESA
jgi:hypothetical protein